MKVISIRYDRLVNTGNYNHEKYGIEIQLDDGDKAQDAIDSAKRLINKQIDITETERAIAEKINN